MYLGYVIDGGELKSIDLAKLEAITKWPNPTYVTKVRIFWGVVDYLQKFITSFLVVVAPLHGIETIGKGFQWRKNQHKYYEDLKRKIN